MARVTVRVKGLSLNRSQKWTALLSKTPRLKPMGRLRMIWHLYIARGWYHFRHADASCRRPPRAVVLWLSHRGGRNRSPHVLSPADVEALTVSSWFSGRDSNLEAFSHNPSDGSFAPLAYQPSTWTKCLNLRFLSYWAGLPWQRRVISMLKPTCHSHDLSLDLVGLSWDMTK